MIKIIGDYRHKVIRGLTLFGKYNLYFPYSEKGFGEGVLSDKEEDFSSFYYKFERVSKKFAEKIRGFVRKASFTGIFSRDKQVLDELIQQNL